MTIKNNKYRHMKLSTIALGALMSFSVATIAQQNPKTNTKTKNTKTVKTKQTKCVKTTTTSVSTNTLLINDDNQISSKVCHACGRG